LKHAAMAVAKRLLAGGVAKCISISCEQLLIFQGLAKLLVDTANVLIDSQVEFDAAVIHFASIWGCSSEKSLQSANSEMERLKQTNLREDESIAVDP